MTFKSIKSKIICGFMSCVAVAAIAFGVVLVIALEFQADNRANIASSAAADAASKTVKATILADAAVSRYLVSASAADKSIMTQRLKDVAALSMGDTGAVERSANTATELITKTQLSSVVVLDQTSALSSSVGTLGEIAASANDVDSNTLVEQISQFYGFSALNIGRYVARQDPPALTAGKDGLKRMVDASAQIQTLPNASKRLKKVAAIVARDSQALSDAVDDLSNQFDSRNQALKTLQGIFTAIATDAQAKLNTATATMADLSAQADVSSNRLMLSLMAGAPAVLLIGIVLAIFIGGSISKPIVALTKSVRLIADGDYHAAVPGKNRTDEIGKMAASVLILEEKAREREQLENDRREESEARVRRADLLDRLVKDFDLSSRRVIEGFLSSANDLSQTANQLADNSVKTSAQAITTSAAATQTSANVTTVAAAAQELQASIAEINNKVVQSADKANEAADIAQQTFDTINELAEAGSEIGDVIKLISAIASQTNLLALNATIEAARAGEAGRGFAIVATEVKTLASQTSSATSQISDKISRIQNITMTAGTAIESIRGAIGSINHMSSAIASAMTEQSSATEEIARSIDEAARGADNVTETISVVSRAADEVRDASRRTQQSTARLSDDATALSEQITQFLSSIRAA